MGGEEVVDALVNVVKVVVYLLEPAALGEICETDQHGRGWVRGGDVPGILRWSHMTRTTSSQSSAESSSRLLNGRGWSAGGSPDGGALTRTATATVFVFDFFAACCFARGPGMMICDDESQPEIITP